MDRPVASVLPRPGRSTRREPNPALAVALLAVPALLFALLLFLYPLSNLIGLSLGLPNFGVESYWRFITNPAYLNTALWTLAVCVFITACCSSSAIPRRCF